MVHHPKVIIAQIECGETVGDGDIVLADIWMRDHPKDYPEYKRCRIRARAEIRAKSAADLAEMLDQNRDWEDRMNADMRKLNEMMRKWRKPDE